MYGLSENDSTESVKRKRILVTASSSLLFSFLSINNTFTSYFYVILNVEFIIKYELLCIILLAIAKFPHLIFSKNAT